MITISRCHLSLVIGLSALVAGGCRKPDAPEPVSVPAPAAPPSPVTKPSGSTSLPVTSHDHPQPPAPHSNAHEVRVEAGDVSVVTFLPLQKLGETLQKDHRRRQFRVAWSCDIGNHPSQGTVLYDRTAKTLDYTLASTGGKKHLSFASVTDKILLKLAQDYPGGGADAGFESLPAYGCKLNKLP